MNKKEESHKGLVALIVCGVITIILIVGCLFFRDEFFGLFKK